MWRCSSPTGRAETAFQPSGVTVNLRKALSPPTWASDPTSFRRTAAYRVILHGFAA